MQIYINRVEISNFCSFIEEVFDFTNYDGLSLICGFIVPLNDDDRELKGIRRNGAGKTTLIDSIAWCLSGKSIKGLNLGNIRNDTVSKKETVRVCLYLSVDTTNYKIVRNLSSKNTSTFEIYKLNDDGSDENLTKPSIETSRIFLEEEILRCSIPIFLKTILMSSMRKQLFFDLSPSEQKKEISNLFDVSIFPEIQTRLTKQLSAYNKNHPSKEFEISQNKANIDSYTEQLEKFNKLKEETVSKLDKEYNELLDELNNLNGVTVSCDDEKIKTIENDIANNNAIFIENNKKIKAIEKKINTNRDDISRLSNGVSASNAKISTQVDILSIVCDDCKFAIDNKFNTSKYQKTINQANKKIESLRLENDNLLKEKSILETEQSDIIHVKNKALQKQIMELTNDRTLLDEKIKSLNLMLSRKKVELDGEKNKSSPFETMLENTKKLFETNKEYQKEYIRNVSKYEIAKDVVSDSKLMSIIVMEMVGTLNDYVRRHLDRYGCYNINIEFLDDMSFVITKNGEKIDSNKINSFSAGERVRLNLAVAFSFRDILTVNSHIITNVLFIDEILDTSLDSEGIHEALDVLTDVSEALQQKFFVVSNREETIALDDVFSHKIQITKTNNISKIENLSGINDI